MPVLEEQEGCCVRNWNTQAASARFFTGLGIVFAWEFGKTVVEEFSALMPGRVQARPRAKP